MYMLHAKASCLPQLLSTSFFDTRFLSDWCRWPGKLPGSSCVLSPHSPALGLQVQINALSFYMRAEDPRSGFCLCTEYVPKWAISLAQLLCVLVHFYGHSDFWGYSLSRLNCFDYKNHWNMFSPFISVSRWKSQCPPSHGDSVQNHIAFVQMGKVQHSLIFYLQWKHSLFQCVNENTMSSNVPLRSQSHLMYQ